MQLEEPLAKDHEMWLGEPPFRPGNVGRVTGEMRNGEEKAPPEYSIVKFPIPTQWWMLCSSDDPGHAFEGANREFAFYSRLWHLGPARFVGKLLPSATTTAQRGRLLLGGVLR
jgi:hypothetical protein